MRGMLYANLLRLPVKLGAPVIGLTGIVSGLWPDKVRAAAGTAVTADHIRFFGVLFLALATIYFAVLWLLKPSDDGRADRELKPDGGHVLNGGQTMNFYFGSGPMQDEVAVLSHDVEARGAIASAAASPPQAIVVSQGTATGHSAASGKGATLAISNGIATGRSTVIGEGITAQASLAQRSQTLAATATVFPDGLYVAAIVVSAAKLADDGVLEIGVRAYNGTDLSLRVSGADGAIHARIGSESETTQLPIPAFSPQRVIIAPRTEFLAVLEQRIPQKLKDGVIKGLSGEHVQLDLRKLDILIEDDAVRVTHTRLPLWDAIAVRRRDDLTIGRVHILEGEAGGYGIVAGTMMITEINAGDDVQKA